LRDSLATGVADMDEVGIWENESMERPLFPEARGVWSFNPIFFPDCICLRGAGVANPSPSMVKVAVEDCTSEDGVRCTWRVSVVAVCVVSLRVAKPMGEAWLGVEVLSLISAFATEADTLAEVTEDAVTSSERGRALFRILGAGVANSALVNVDPGAEILADCSVSSVPVLFVSFVRFGIDCDTIGDITAVLSSRRSFWKGFDATKASSLLLLGVMTSDEAAVETFGT